eukprot:13426321-Alexandrium_andersonii.AAC.1
MALSSEELSFSLTSESGGSAPELQFCVELHSSSKLHPFRGLAPDCCSARIAVGLPLIPPGFVV